MISNVISRSFKLELIKGCYCVGSAEALFVISKMTPYSIQFTANRFIDNEHPESLQKDPEGLQKAFRRHSKPPISKVELILCSKY